MSITLSSAVLIYISPDNSQIVLHRKKKIVKNMLLQSSSLVTVQFLRNYSQVQCGCSLLSLLSVLKDQNCVREALLGSANCLVHFFISSSSDRRNSGEHMSLTTICCSFPIQIPSIQNCWVRTGRYISYISLVFKNVAPELTSCLFVTLVCTNTAL